jgi:hypothetical protein
VLFRNGGRTGKSAKEVEDSERVDELDVTDVIELENMLELDAKRIEDSEAVVELKRMLELEGSASDAGVPHGFTLFGQSHSRTTVQLDSCSTSLGAGVRQKHEHSELTLLVGKKN